MQKCTSLLNCDSGEHLTCRSSRVPGLSYIVGENSNCKIEFRENTKTKLPLCAKIDGFEVEEKEDAKERDVSLR